MTPTHLDTPADATELLDLTIREILERFGSVRGFHAYLDARREAALSRLARLHAASSEGTPS